MDVEKAFHMTGGVGKTSYAKNSSLQVLSFFLFFLSSQSTIYNIFPHHFLVLVYNWILCVYTYIPYLILLFQQKKESDKVKHIIIQTVEELYLATTPKSIGIADLGCSSGPNTLSIIKDIFQAIQGTSQRTLPHQSWDWLPLLQPLLCYILQMRRALRIRIPSRMTSHRSFNFLFSFLDKNYNCYTYVFSTIFVVIFVYFWL